MSDRRPPDSVALAPVALEQILARLAGPAMLVPIPPNQKGPRHYGWNKPPPDAMHDPVYLAQFRPGGNIGVLLGEASAGLCTVDLDGQEELETFLAINPALRATLQTKRVRGGNLWVRIKGFYPEFDKLRERATKRELGEWRSTGFQTVIHGAAIDTTKGETEPTAYRIVHDAPPLEISYDEIVWPDDWLPPGTEEEDPGARAERELVEEHGEPFTKSGKGKIALNNMYFVARFARPGDVLFEPSENQFYGYDPGRGLWQRATEAGIRVDVATMLKEYADGQDPSARQQIINARTAPTLAGMASLLQGFVEERGTFTRQHGIIHVGNGMLHISAAAAELRAFAPEYRSRNATPLVYDPLADCPRFKRELLQAALAPTDVSLVQRHAGSVLLGYNRAQKIIVYVGTAGGGKSTLLEILEHVLGRENVAEIRTEHLTKQFEIARYIGKQMLTGKDVPGRFLEAEGAGRLKALVGHDLLDAERKGSNGDFKLVGDFGVIITCNSRLKVRLDGDADAWRRRLLIVKYERPRPERPERDFAATLLAAEGPGILRWMVEGAQMHLAELERCGDFELTVQQRQRVDALLAESDSVREFIRQRVERHEGSDVSVHELVEAYTAYCEEMAWEPRSVRQVENALADAMQELRRAARRNDIDRDGPKKGFKGVRIIEAVEAAEV